MFDTVIPNVLWLYAVCLFLMVALPQHRTLNVIVLGAVCLRFFSIGLRTSLGSDIAPYTSVLSDCDLTSINAIEVLWQFGCLPSHWLKDSIPFPFLWIGLIDTVLFLVLVKVGGWRLAAFHDLIYLPSTSMGAIRQALAMKLILLAVLLFVRSKDDLQSGGRSAALVASTPLIHLSSVVPTAVLVFARSGVATRLLILLGSVAGFYAIASIVDETLLAKIYFYLEFEGFRSSQDIYASWVKRVLVVGVGLFLTRPDRRVWLLYGVGLAFAATEPFVPEIAVRVGTYFEQFEVLIIAAAMRSSLRNMGVIWYSTAGLAYAARFILNVQGLPWEG